MAEQYEQVRIKKSYKDKLQQHKKDTGIAMSVFLEKAIDNEFNRLSTLKRSETLTELQTLTPTSNE